MSFYGDLIDEMHAESKLNYPIEKRLGRELTFDEKWELSVQRRSLNLSIDQALIIVSQLNDRLAKAKLKTDLDTARAVAKSQGYKLVKITKGRKG